MGVTASLSVSLTPELERFIEQRVAAGLNQSAEDVVREALLALKMDQRDIDTAFTDLKSKLEDAAKEEQNDGEMVDGDAFMSGLLMRLKERRRGEIADAEPAVPGWRMKGDDLFG